MSALPEVTDATFDAEIAQGPAVVKLWSDG